MSLINKDELIIDCADAYRTASGTTEAVKAGELAQKISELSGGGDLPALDNPATASDILVGKEAIDEYGNKITGTQDVIKFATGIAAEETDFGGASIDWKFENVLNRCSIYHHSNLVEAKITAPAITSNGLSFYAKSTSDSALRKVTINADLSGITYYAYCFFQNPLLTEVDADLDFTSTTSVGGMFQSSHVEKARFVPNTLSLGWNVSNGSAYWNDSTLVSAANALKDGAVGTLTLHATPKARCQTLKGIVSQQTRDGVTFNFFTEDESGETTLAQFITLTKGWTLA